MAPNGVNVLFLLIPVALAIVAGVVLALFDNRLTGRSAAPPAAASDGTEDSQATERRAA